jgi:hypothetical protein
MGACILPAGLQLAPPPLAPKLPFCGTLVYVRWPQITPGRPPEAIWGDLVISQTARFPQHWNH